MLGWHMQRHKESISFKLNDALKIVLQDNKPPFASHLSLMQNNSRIIDISISTDNYNALKNELRKPECTADSLLVLLHHLNLTKFASEVQNELQHTPQGPTCT
ncbi:hypothetical protein [Legionella saoudiensis]|uniref:hypothetical protein n=1 Tax=Legionella saoudiensis TaxID=1750561 RepID=UPI000730E27E|nr:hypothetical protein [Legionella saoudiensis]